MLRRLRSQGLRFCFAASFLAVPGCAHGPGASSPSARPEPISAEVKVIGGKPTLHFNGQPETPIIYAITDSPGGQWSWDEFPRWNIANFARAGFRIIQFSLWLEDLWHEDGSLDLARAQRQLRGVLDAAPGAILFLRLHINAPFWWNRRHPEETVQYADIEGKLPEPFWGIRRHVIDAYELDGGRLHSLASRRWRADTTEVLTRLLRGLAAMPEGNALGMVNLCTGVSHEWHNWGFLAHDPDTSAPMTASFRDWLRRKYRTDAALRAAWNDAAVTLDSAAVPGSEPRKRTLDGVFRDPRRERAVMDYFEAQHDVVVDDILYFNHLVKALWPRPLVVGNFYGYYFTMFSRQTTGGHLAVDRFLRSPDVDFLAAPQSYYTPARGQGGSGMSRAVVESARLHGKLVLDEMDQSTQMRHPFAEPTPEERQDDRALIRRNTLSPLLRGAGMWFYDFGPNHQTGWWAHPDYTEEARRLKALFDERRAAPYHSDADVLAVWDTQSYYDVAAGWTPISETTLDAVAEDLHHAGVLFDSVFFDDLPLVLPERYRVVFIANAWRMDEARRRLLSDRFMTGGRTIVFQYMPGYSDGTATDWANVARVTGFAIRAGTPRGHAVTQVFGEALPDVRFGIPEYKTPLSPFPVVVDAEAQALGKLDAVPGDVVTLAQKRRPDGGTTIYSSLPLRSPALLRSLFAKAGAHIYTTEGDALGGGMGLLWLHTRDGGARTLTLHNGKSVALVLAPRSTSVLDARTGAVLF